LSEPAYYFVAIDVAQPDSPSVSERMFELGANGIEERDESTLVRGALDKVTLVASFSTEAEARVAKRALGTRARIERLLGDAWRDAWKEHFRPFRLCNGLWVRPPWQAHRAKRGETVLVLEPGRAFGTGLHETTRLVARVIASLQLREASRLRSVRSQRVLDVGTGSGILSLAALAFGARSALGIDIDADAIDVANENAKRNTMRKRASFSTTPLARVKGTFDLVLANIEADVLVAHKRALQARMARGGRLVLSGILDSREADVRAAFGKPEARAKLGEWVALTYAS
jgi:ribosomal protein L11 methyltransferase